jgi:hypothetical protein
MPADLAYPMLSAAAGNPVDRSLLSGSWPSAVSATDLPADTSPRDTSLDWRYALRSLPQAQKDLLFRYAAAEIGAGQGDTSRQAFLEAAANRLEAARARARELGQGEPTMADVLTGSIPYGKRGNIGGAYYYPRITRARAAAPLDPASRPYWEGLYGRVTGDPQGIPPSNVANYGTGNESGGVHSGGAPVTAAYGGERYVAENWTLPWFRQMHGEAPVSVATESSTSSAAPPSGGSTMRAGSSPAVAEGSTGGSMSSLPNAGLAQIMLDLAANPERYQAGSGFADAFKPMPAPIQRAPSPSYRRFFQGGMNA